MKRLFSIVLSVVLVLGMASFAGAEGEYISVISKGEQHAFWQTVNKGCKDAAAEYGIDMHYYGPPSESDIALQVEELKGELAKEPNAVALAALDTASVLTELQQCIDKGIPVIGFDSGVPDAPEGAIYATASTDNKNAAAIAAEELFKLEGFQDKLAAATADAPVVIAVLSQEVTSQSITDRTTGFVEKMKALAGEIGTVAVQGHSNWAEAAEGASIIIHVQIGATTGVVDMTNAANTILDLDGLYAMFCTNEGAVTGLLSATADGSELAEGARFGDVLVAGFDSGETQLNAIRQGWFVGAVTQDPYRIGYLAVEMAAKAARGEAVEDVDTGAHWYTVENMDDPAIAMLLYD